MTRFYFLFFCISFHLMTFSQVDLFTKSDIDIPLLTNHDNNQITIMLNRDYFNSINEVNPCDLNIELPFFQNESINITLDAFNTYTDDFQLLRSTETGLIYDDYKPIIHSYRISTVDGWTGSISFMKNYLIGVIKKNGQVYEIKNITNDIYVLFDVNQSIAPSNFSCQTVTEDFNIPNNSNNPAQMGGGTECLEMGIEIDNYTFNQFNDNCYDAVEWALALLAGVNEIYMSELNDIVTLQARYINVWEIVDNYDPFNDCGDMLDEMPNYWTNPPFDAIYEQTDLVHLFSRKSANGGIAWLSALCGGEWNSNTGFGVTSGLNTTLTYDYPDNTPYSYNLSYLGHEIGHNFGANHTHNCGWDADVSINFPGGAIDACSAVEGSCDNPGIPPDEVWQQSLGTIMSYCDLGSVGITLEFHSIVENQALIPGVNNASCLNSCDELESSCGNSIYGCTDSIAENYNPQANINDDSCEYIYGCTSINSDNYNPNATMDDGSCICSGEINLYLETDYYSNEIGWELLDDDDNIINSVNIGDYFQGGETITNTYCLSPGCYSFNVYDEWGDGISSENTAGNTPNFYILLSINGNYLVEMGDSDFGDESINPFCICVSDNDNDGICDEDEISGCTDSSYLEFNINATEDDGSCLNLIVEGCTDSLACNYDSESNTDDGSCEYPLENFDCDDNCLSDINNDAICDLFGCMNSDACNYDSNANIDDSSCEFPPMYYDCDGNCIVFDDCGQCGGDNTTCSGCTDLLACNYDDTAIVNDGCEYPLENFDCNGNCLVETDCNGECAGTAIYDECGECAGSGPEEFYDCDGNCLGDIDQDGICDPLDNCLEEFNPSQIDNDNDGYGDECSCQYIDIFGEIIVEVGEYEIYTLSSSIDNTASWDVVGGNITWSSSTEPSIAIQWLEEGEGTVSITQYFGDNASCTIDLNVTVISSSVDLDEVTSSTKKILLMTDLLGRSINIHNNHHCIMYIYDDGSVEKLYNYK